MTDVLVYDFKISFDDAMILLVYSPEFRAFCTYVMGLIPFDQYYWYMGKINNTESFKFFIKKWKSKNTVITPDGEEIVKEDLTSFKEHLDKIPFNKDTTIFTNKNADAYLMIPKYYPNKTNTYSTIANFMKYAPKKQINNFWKDIGNEALLLTSKKYGPIYINTHGDGVSYLHVRFDFKYKYLNWMPNI
jgi:hypothetical protein